MDQQQIERIRNPRFSVVRRGYDQREVDNSMLALAEWLENGGLEEAGSYAVTRRLERAGETTARVLATAESEADQIVKDAEAEARRTVADAQEAARKKLEQTRAQAKDMVEEAERKRAEIKDTISQLSDVQRRVIEEIGRLREALGAAVAAAPAAPTQPAELPPGDADAHQRQRRQPTSTH
jgi:cell division septum initiation protein DivIVA